MSVNYSLVKKILTNKNLQREFDFQKCCEVLGDEASVTAIGNTWKSCKTLLELIKWALIMRNVEEFPADSPENKLSFDRGVHAVLAFFEDCANESAEVTTQRTQKQLTKNLNQL